MASEQKSSEEHARSAAQKAADELAASMRERDQAHEAAPVSPRGGGAILSSVQESARNVMGEAKDKAAVAMESAKEYAADAKEGARRALAGDAVGRKGETDESAWQQGQDVRRRAAEKAREAAARGAREPPSEEEKGRAATENIYGAARGATGAFREKMVMPTDVVEHKRAEVAGRGKGGGGEGAGRPTAGTGDDEEEDVMLRVKRVKVVGKMGEEGTGMPRRR